MRDFMNVAKALADENRVRALMALEDRELCVCQIIELLGLAPSTVSKHMSILKQARLVQSRKNGRWTYYRLAGKDATPEARDALARIRKLLQEDRVIQEDKKTLRAIVRKNPEELCRLQARATHGYQDGRNDAGNAHVGAGVRGFRLRAKE